MQDIRQSYMLFPTWSQHFFTWLTGKALPYQRPIFTMGTWLQYFVPIFMVLLGVIGATWVLTTNANSFFLLVCWIISLSGARLIALTIRHQCIHSAFSGKPKLDMWLAEIATALIYGQDAQSYKIDHISKHHNRKALASEKDSHVIAIQKYGFKPGMSKKNLWINLFILIISPIFQIKHSIARLKCNFFYPSYVRRGLSILTLMSWIGILSLFSNSLLDFTYKFFIAFVIPLFVLCNISVILEMIAEHQYFGEIEDTSLSNEKYAEKCWAVFCGERLPNTNHNSFFKNAVMWLMWSIKMFMHFLIRLTILPGDIVVHDFHHRHPYSKEWKSYAYARQKDIDKGHPGWPEYKEIWGLFNAIDQVFLSMSIKK